MTRAIHALKTGRTLRFRQGRRNRGKRVEHGKSVPAGKSEISDFTNVEEIEFQPTPSCDLDGYGTEIAIQMEGFGPKDLINASIASWVSDTRLTPSGRTDRAKIEFSQGGSGSKKSTLT